jgi:electron transfer flavoprotein beta subunit
MLSWSCGNVVLKLEFAADGRSLTVEREIEGGARENLELTMPAVVTATKGLNTPRYPSLKGIMAAKKKEIKELTPDSLGTAGTAMLSFGDLRLPPERKQGTVIPGEPREAAEKLVKLLREEAKII